MRETTLFSEDSLSQYLRQERIKVDRVLQNYDPDELLHTAEADVVAYLIEVGQVEEITLLREQRYGLDPVEFDANLHQNNDQGVPAFGAHPHFVTRWTLVVPFSGDYRVFHLRASTYSLSPPRASIASSELHIYYDRDNASTTTNGIGDYLDGVLDQIERNLRYTNNDIANHNKVIAREVPTKAAARRTKHLADKKVRADLGFPIKSRADADNYAIPVKRRQIVPRRPAPPRSSGSAFTPDPFMADADYEAALAVLRHGRNALERSPSTTSKHDEEGIRDLLLFLLNGQFEGQAGGELFNGHGKTDILIRDHDDRNVFVGECKIWDGPKKCTDALNQLLSYMTWRDTKAALLIFIKQGDITTIAKKAVAAVREHTNFKRDGEQANEERHDFVLHSNGDSNRELRLALMIFAIPSRHEPDGGH